MAPRLRDIRSPVVRVPWSRTRRLKVQTLWLEQLGVGCNHGYLDVVSFLFDFFVVVLAWLPCRQGRVGCTSGVPPNVLRAVGVYPRPVS